MNYSLKKNKSVERHILHVPRGLRGTNIIYFNPFEYKLGCSGY